MLWGLCQGQAGQPGGRSPTVPARSRAVRDSGHLPDDGAGLMEPGCGPAGGGPCRAPWCPWQAQSWLWYRRGCGTGGDQGVEAWTKQLLREGGLPAALSGAPPEAAGGRGSLLSRLALSTGSQASRRGAISGPFPRCFCLEIKNTVYGCISSSKALQASPLQRVTLNFLAAFFLPPACT